MKLNFGIFLILYLYSTTKCDDTIITTTTTTEQIENFESESAEPINNSESGSTAPSDPDSGPSKIETIEIEIVNTDDQYDDDSLSIMEEEDDHLLLSSTILKRILSPDIYDKSVRPRGGNGTTDDNAPVKVYVSLYIRSIENIDDFSMEYTVQMTFRETWYDQRLVYGHIHPNISVIQLANSDNLWIPDIFFSNEKFGNLHQLMVPNFFGRILPNGEVYVSYRVTLLLSCPMLLHSYPLDTQWCPFKMASYGYSDKDLDLAWKSTGTIQMATTFNLPDFYLNSFKLEYCEVITSTGRYPCIQIDFEFERQLGYYMIQIYAPCIMLVLVSWVSFWLEPSATEARCSIAVTVILSVVTQTNSVNDQTPPSSYIKAIDVWTFIVQFMVFASVIQFAYINYIVHYSWKRIAKNLSDSDEYLRENKSPVLKERAETSAKIVDNFCKICFPMGFGIFNIIYWCYYLL